MNYTQIFRNGWAISGTAKAVKFLTGSKLAHNKKMCASYHAEDMERTFLWGKKTITTLNGKQFRLTDGVVQQIERSEEHTSELQSLMRISYAVFCLITTTKQYTTIIYRSHTHTKTQEVVIANIK